MAQLSIKCASDWKVLVGPVIRLDGRSCPFHSFADPTSLDIDEVGSALLRLMHKHQAFFWKGKGTP